MFSDAQIDDLWQDDRYTVDARQVEDAVADGDRLRAGIAQLSAPQRAVLLLHYAQGWKLSEIADLTDSPLPTVKSHLRRGRQALVSLLARDEADDR